MAMRTHPFRIHKTPYLMLTCFGLWLALVVHYDPLLFPLFDSIDAPVARVLLALAIGWVNLVWFYGGFHLASVVFSQLAQRLPEVPEAVDQGTGRVAVLYAICNDFDGRAARSCVDQDHESFLVYLLDDSTRDEERRRVDAFAAGNAGRCAVVRRPDRSGFKAGNLNHALMTVAHDCRYFAVVDADEVLPRDFLRRATRCFGLDPRIGFVQANHRYVRGAARTFAGDMSRGVDLHWGQFLPARNEGGFVMFYGHGAVIRREVWERVGGFPEIVSEDIGFTARARVQGFFGLFLRDLVAEETFPGSYQQFLRRELKVVKGTLQFLRGPGIGFLRAPKVSLIEKLDCVASCLVLFLPVFFLAFVLLADVALPYLIAHERLVRTVGPAATVGAAASGMEVLGASLRHLWTWDFYLLTLYTILSPLIYQWMAFLRAPRDFARYALRSTTVFLSIIPAVAVGLISGLTRRKFDFKPTGDRQGQGEGGVMTQALSGLLGLLLVTVGVLTGNVALMTVALAFALHAVFLGVRWESRIVRFSSLVPLVFFVAVFGAIPFVALGVAGALAAAMPAHH